MLNPLYLVNNRANACSFSWNPKQVFSFNKTVSPLAIIGIVHEFPPSNHSCIRPKLLEYTNLQDIVSQREVVARIYPSVVLPSANTMPYKPPYKKHFNCTTTIVIESRMVISALE